VPYLEVLVRQMPRCLSVPAAIEHALEVELSHEAVREREPESMRVDARRRRLGLDRSSPNARLLERLSGFAQV
jgi:hypothetical protein